MVNTGWPETIKEVPDNLRQYWSFRDEIGVSQGVLFKGRQVIIPQSLQGDILKQLHAGHMGVEKTRRLARESVYWPNINDHIQKLIAKCDTCRECDPRQEKEPLIPHEIPPSPWTKLNVKQATYVLLKFQVKLLSY